LKRFGELKNSKIIGGKSNLLEATGLFLKMLYSKKKQFYGVSPVFNEEWVGAVRNLAKSDCEVSLVFTDDVLRYVGEKLGRDDAQTLDARMSITITKIDSAPDVAFAVFEDFLIMTLRMRDGTFTTHKGIYSKDSKALGWGRDLFEYYKRQAKEVNIADYC